MRGQCIGRMVVVIALLARGAIVGAQSIDADIPDTQDDRDGFSIGASYGHRFEAELKDTRGNPKFSTDDARLAVRGTADFGGVRWLNAFSYGFTAYQPENLSNSNIHTFALASILGIDVAKTCAILVGPVVSMSAEEDADWSDALSYGGLIGTVYRPSRDLSLGLSVIAVRRIEEGIGLTPIPMVNWRFADDWRLHTGLTEVAARSGLGGFVAWTFARDWEAAAGVQFEHRRFRLDVADAIGEDKSAPAYLQLSWQMVDGLNLDAVGGVVFGGRFKVNDKDDHFVVGNDYKAAPLVGVRLRYAMGA